jgi:hypothetical protein
MGGDQKASVSSAVATWAAQPFKTDMSVMGWALFLGLIIVLTILWHFVLREITEVA